MALLGPREMSDLSPQSGPKRTLIRPRSSSDVLDNRFTQLGRQSYRARGATSSKNFAKRLRNSSGTPSVPFDSIGTAV